MNKHIYLCIYELYYKWLSVWAGVKVSLFVCRVKWLFGTAVEGSVEEKVGFKWHLSDS